ncbi:MFS transporter [Ponticaulis sp.]|uniref:MFS transporter n=1 Tax=Ponticaulis sp. TaxID=2020902 RepID=UPI000FEF4ADD|nr:MFS transporter [Ponticaulis sp.]RPG17724.1 MAG: MFS transporter [Hyphomonadaceae bacterium TMED125]
MSSSDNPALEAEEDRLSTGIKVSWGIGALGTAILMNSVSALIVYYLARVVGMESWIAGLLLSLGRILDAGTDPFMGYISDKTPNKWGGRRRPYLLIGAVLSAISILLIFNVPFRGSGVETIIYVLFTLIFFGLGYTIFNVHFIAMPAEMTSNYHERSSIHSWRVIFAGMGMAIAFAGSGVLLDWLADGRTDANGVQLNTSGDYAILSLVFGVLILVSMVIAWNGTRKAKMTTNTSKPVPGKEQMKSFFSNKSFLTIIGVKASQLIAVYASQTAQFFMVVEVLKRTSDQMALISLPMVAVSILSAPLLVRFSRKFGKRWGYILSALFTCASYLSWIVSDPNEPGYMLAIRGMILGVGFAGNVMFAMSMITDAIELDSIRTGMNREGMYTAAFSFIEKSAGAMGPALVGAALSFAGFDSSAEVNIDNYEAVRQATLFGVAYIPAFFALVSVGILSFYKLDEKALAEARAEKALRDAAEAEA